MNLLASDDEWTAPIMAEVGPDGNVWVLDWYNYIVQHNPTPAGFKTGRGNAYESDLRDKRHGRIYRVVYGSHESRTGKKLDLSRASPEQLVATLTHPTMLWRKHAQRLLVERGDLDVIPSLLLLVGNQDVDRVGLNVGAIHALWTIHGLGVLESSDSNADAFRAVVRSLAHPSAGVRRNSVQVLPRDHRGSQALLDSGVLSDADAQVRLAAVLALSDIAPVELCRAGIGRVSSEHREHE